MEIVKFVDKDYKNLESIENVVNYVTRSDATRGYVGSDNVLLDNCVNEMESISEVLKCKGNRLHHIVVSSFITYLTLLFINISMKSYERKSNIKHGLKIKILE